MKANMLSNPIDSVLKLSMINALTWSRYFYQLGEQALRFYGLDDPYRYLKRPAK